MHFLTVNAALFLAGLAGAMAAPHRQYARTELAINETFADLDNWADGSQGGGGPANYSIQLDQRGTVDGSALVFQVQPFSTYRPKVKYTPETTMAGTHVWRVYVPLFESGDVTSIGAFIYSNDYQEFDFECGFGSPSTRTSLGLSDTDTSMACAMTSQSTTGNTWDTLSTTWTAIVSEDWHIFQLELDEVANGTWLATWSIDGSQVNQLQQSWGPANMTVGFTPFCSLENLWWMGNYGNPPVFPTDVERDNNYAVFDYYTYTPE